jgi:hypothetical protein
MNFPKRLMLGSVLLLGATSVLADTVDLRVIGTIAPGACTPVISGGATIDYGLIPISTLNNAAATTLASHDVGYTISCNAPIPIFTTWSDARAGSVTSPNLRSFGLGTHGGNIGYYNISYVVSGTTGDGNPITLISKQTAGGNWLPGATIVTAFTDTVHQTSFAPLSSLVPGAYSVYAGTLRVTATINPTGTFDTTTDVALDGLSTMTINYI